MIELRVQGGNSHQEKTYDFQELLDLISRIVLISGKSKSDDRTGMHKFLEVGIIVVAYVMHVLVWLLPSYFHVQWFLFDTGVS